MEYYSAIKKNKIMPFTLKAKRPKGKKDGPGDYQTKWSKSDRERRISYDVVYMQNLLKNDTDECIDKTETYLQT